MGFLEELKRRNVFRVGIAYAVTAWLITQVLEVALESFGSPEWVMKTVLVVLAAGLPLALIFAWAFELTPEGLKREKDVDRTKSITPQTGRKLDYVIIGVLAIAVVFLLLDRFIPGSKDGSGANPASGVAQTAGEAGMAPGEEAAAKPASPKSVAVLPFVNMSSDPEQEYFSDGISEEILNALARVKDLKVAGRTSSFAFKGQNQDLRKIGEALGVANILEGSVRKSGNTVRITAQLIQVADGFHLWSDTYDRQLDNIFAIQDEIAGAILEQLKATLIGSDSNSLAADRTNSEAYDYYLLAKQRMYERKEAPLKSAVALLDKAIALDPIYAPAYAQRAVATMLLRDTQYGSIPKEQALKEAKLYIDKALALDPGLAEANAALGLYHYSRPGESERAVEPLKKALALNPGLVDAANWLSGSLANLGRLEEARELLEDMVERDPFYRPGLYGAVEWYNITGKTAESKAFVDRISAFFPDDPMISLLKGRTLMAEGHPGDALALLEAAVEREPGSMASRSALGRALIDTGQYERAAEIDAPFQKAWALVFLGRQEEARIILSELASSGEDISDYINLSVLTGHYAEVVEFFETRWPDFDAFEADFPPFGRIDLYTYADLAQAYAAEGNEQRFRDCMTRYRTHLDRARELGLASVILDVMEALYFALSGDHETAVKNLDRAVDAGYLGYPRMSKEWVQLKPLEGDPEFEAVQARMVAHLNAERAKVGLGPMSI